jgi:drug/metabolite transporter (DMT)-like permease
MNNKLSSFIIYISIVLAVVFWGFSFIWTNSLLISGLTPFTLILTRLIFAGIILLTISISSRKLQKIKKADWKWFLMLVSLEPFFYFIGETLGIKILASPSLSSIIISTIPIFASFAGIIVYKERLTKINFFGIFLTIPGILLVVFENSEAGIGNISGILFLFLAVFAAVGYSLVVKKLADKYNSITIVTYQHSIGALFFVPLFLVTELDTFSFSLLTSKALISLIALALFCSSLAFIFFINSIKELGVARANVFTTIVPAVAAVGAFFLGQEPLGTRKLVGILIVITGVIIAQRQKKLKTT